MNNPTKNRYVLKLTEDLCAMLLDNYHKAGYSMKKEFVVEEGKKYFKIIHVGNGRSIHAFVDIQNGDLYKAASWKAPAKGVRFNLITDAVLLESVIDWAGGYLYK